MTSLRVVRQKLIMVSSQIMRDVENLENQSDFSIFYFLDFVCLYCDGRVGGQRTLVQTKTVSEQRRIKTEETS